MTREQALHERDFLDTCLRNKFFGSAAQRKVWRFRRSILNKGLKQLNPNHHAKTNHHSATPHSVPVRHN